MGMDVTIVNVALPSIEEELHVTLSGLQWIIDAYTLAVASLLMLAGSVSDRHGRRRIFQVGLCLFTLGSLLCSLAPSIGGLVGFRIVQGLGASMLNPVALSIIANAFSEPQERARAVGIWGAVAGISFALGPLLGGALTQAISWRANFWINVPIGIAAVILTAKFVPESKASRPRAFDPVGQLLIALALATLTYGLIEGPHSGWNSALITGLFACSAILFTAFLLYEPLRKDALLDLRFFRSVPFSTAMITGFCAYACFAAFLFLNALYLQQQRGLSAFRTGLYTLPLAVLLMICAPLSGRLVGRTGPRRSLMAAGAGFSLSTVLLTNLSIGTPLLILVLSYVLFGIALGMVNPAITNSAVAGMPLAQAGVAAAVASTSRQVGAALGVAIAGTVVSTRHAQENDFARATHPIWWLMVGCGAVILALGWTSSTAWALTSAERVAHLVDTAEASYESISKSA